METQCLGLAEALGLTPLVKRIHPRAPWRWLPPNLWWRALAALDPGRGDTLAPPWPELLIASGRQSIAPTIAVGRASGGLTFTVMIQDPRVDPAHFGLVIAPEHDRITGPNVLRIKGSITRIAPDRLAAAAAAYADRVAGLPRPLIAVLIGGNSKVHRLTPERARALAEELLAAARSSGGSLLVTPSRRTGAENEGILRQALTAAPGEFWAHQGDNPYFAYLGLADAIVVTGDSVNMVSEAASTGKPVHIADLPGGSAKFSRFHQSFFDAGIARPFAGRIETWSYPPLNETARAAEALKASWTTAPEV
jgi:mitochondrial fission protein ELM1